ncbi:MAG: SufD family Fe-S cluster assembly protein [Thermoplasmata archaeon]
MAVARMESWVSPHHVDELAAALHDPAEFAERRRKALSLVAELPLEPNPLYRKYGYFAGVDLTGIDALPKGAPVPLPPALPHTVRVVHDASGTRIESPTSVRDVGVTATPLAEIWSGPPEERAEFLRGTEVPSDRLSALGLTLLNRGYRLVVPNDCPRPVHVQDITVLSQPHEALDVRRSLKVGKDARLLVSEEVYSAASGPGHQRLYGSSVDVDAGPGSQVAYLTVHAPDPQAVSAYARHATTEAGAKLGWIWTGFGGFRTKARNRTTLRGNGSDVEDLQTFFGDGDQSYDSAVDLTHTGTDTHGQSITRGVFKDRARGMSRGLVRIEKEARKTISYISEHAMLLAKGARSDTIPILEILCRDVKATHSTSVAPVDPERVFYLESRGLPRSTAIRMIGEGFLSHVLERAPIANLRELLYPTLAVRWDGGMPVWQDGDFPSLPALHFSGTDVGTDWRFDAKLR